MLEENELEHSSLSEDPETDAETYEDEADYEYGDEEEQD